FFFSSRRRHTRFSRDWSSDVCSSDLSNPEERTPVAIVRDLSLTYGRKRALDSVSLEVPAGRMVGLIGPDGVGKSSLLALISGAQIGRASCRKSLAPGDSCRSTEKKQT